MVGLFWSTRFTYGLSLRRPPVFVWLDSQRGSPGILMVELLGAPQVFIWLDSWSPPGIRIEGLLEAFQF